MSRKYRKPVPAKINVNSSRAHVINLDVQDFIESYTLSSSTNQTKLIITFHC